MKKETKVKLIKISVIVLILIAICLAIYLPLQLTGTLNKIDSAEELKEIILKGGAYSYLIFFVIQFLQVCLVPIPAIITTLAGTMVFGPWITSLISIIAVISASVFSFFLGKKIGRKLVVWVAGEEETKKWEEKINRGKYVFFLMMLFPFFPDDILCLVAGATGMTYKFFIITNIITRPIGIISTCFLGSGQLIPFSGWGIPVWIILIILGAILFYLSFKFQPQIENFVLKLAGKMDKNKNNSTNNNKEKNSTKTNIKTTETSENQLESNNNQNNNINKQS